MIREETALVTRLKRTNENRQFNLKNTSTLFSKQMKIRTYTGRMIDELATIRLSYNEWAHKKIQTFDR